MRLSRFTLLGGLVAAAASGGQARAQNYPWCSNFADGAGTNCGWQTLEQCMTAVSGSGGYCDHNNLYKPPMGEAAAPRRPRKNNAHKRS